MGSIILEKIASVAVITMNRPERKNALNASLRRKLFQTLQQIESDKNIRAAVITGTGDAFVAGADIQAMKQYSVNDAVESSKEGSRIFSYLEAMKIPVIAAINGWALGGGLELALACDFRVCSDTAQFGQPEVKLGILPGYGANIRLPRIIGLAKAKELIFFGRIITAREAESLGLVSCVTSPSNLMEKALEMASKLAQGPASIALAKKAIHSALDLSLNEAMEMSSTLYGEAYNTNDTKEGITAYIQKRKPLFKGN